jgi:hypothetical protein
MLKLICLAATNSKALLTKLQKMICLLLTHFTNSETEFQYFKACKTTPIAKASIKANDDRKN